MAKGQQWCFVFEKDREKLKKYFPREMSGPIYIRIYQKNRVGSFEQYFQMSGNDVGYNSIKLKSDDQELQIRRDFPFIKTLNVWDI